VLTTSGVWTRLFDVLSPTYEVLAACVSITVAERIAREKGYAPLRTWEEKGERA
jgi:hypothetical protein